MSRQELLSSGIRGLLKLSNRSCVRMYQSDDANRNMRERTAARPAPLRPISGTGPMPKIRIGSRIMLMIEVPTSSMLGIRVSPVARMQLDPTMPTTTKGTPK